MAEKRRIQRQNHRIPSESSNYSGTTTSSYPYSSTSDHRRNSGFNTLGKNIIGNGGRISGTNSREGDYSSTIKKPTNYHKITEDYKDNIMYRPPKLSSKVNSQPASSYNRDEDILSRYSKKRVTEPEVSKVKEWDRNYSNQDRHKFKNDPMNETFTSLKAKRNVSDYQNSQVSRPIYSREKESSKRDARTSPGFSTMGLENIGNT